MPSVLPVSIFSAKALPHLPIFSLFACLIFKADDCVYTTGNKAILLPYLSETVRSLQSLPIFNSDRFQCSCGVCFCATINKWHYNLNECDDIFTYVKCTTKIDDARERYLATQYHFEHTPKETIRIAFRLLWYNEQLIVEENIGHDARKQHSFYGIFAWNTFKIRWIRLVCIASEYNYHVRAIKSTHLMPSSWRRLWFYSYRFQIAKRRFVQTFPIFRQRLIN